MRLRRAVPMMMLLLLCACGAAKTSAQTPVRFRTELLEAGQLSCQLVLRADYGEYVRDFTLDCLYTPDEASLQVVEPEIAKGITASVSGEGAKVSYDSTVLAVENFESRRISPMAAPYLLGKAWTEGYIASMGESDGLETTEYTLGYGGDTLKITTDFQDGRPVHGEISDGQTVLISCEIKDLRLEKKEAEQNEDVKTYVGGGQP